MRVTTSKEQDVRIVFAGTPEVAVPSLQRLIESPDHEVVGVISRPDAVAGRGRKVSRSPVAELADANGIEVITPRRMAEPDVADTLRGWQPDVGAVVAYGGLIPPDVLGIPTHGWINLHFSVLPAWRGAAPRRQYGEVQVDPTVRRDPEDVRWDQTAVGDDGPHVGLPPTECVGDVGFGHPARCDDLDAVGVGQFGDRRARHLTTASRDSIGARDHSDDLVVGRLDQSLQ